MKNLLAVIQTAVAVDLIANQKLVLHTVNNLGVLDHLAPLDLSKALIKVRLQQHHNKIFIYC